MKKFLVTCAIATLCAISANAQDAASSAPVNPSQVASQKKPMNKNKEQVQERRKERLEKASPEQRARMEKRHEMMEKLSPQQKEEAKKEMERHRAEMKRITGFEMAPPPAHHE